MKHITHNTYTAPIVQIQEQRSNEDFSGLKETIIPSPYIVALTKERKCLKSRKPQPFPTLKDLLKRDSEDHLDPSLIKDSLELLLKGNLSCMENTKGNVEFLKFTAEKSDALTPAITGDHIDYLNLDKIPVYLITTKNDNLLTFKVFKKQHCVIGFLNFEDAFIYLNDFQHNKLWLNRAGASFKKIANLRNEQSLKITTLNLESFYQIWAENKVKASLIPGPSGFGKTTYITEKPFYVENNKNVFLTSFSKKALKEQLKKVPSCDKRIVSIDTNDFFELSNRFSGQYDNLYFFVPYKVPYKETEYSAKELLEKLDESNLNKNSYLPKLKEEPADFENIIVPSGFLSFLPSSIRTPLYSSFQNWSERLKSDHEKRKKKRARKKRRRKHLKQRFSRRRKTRRYFRKSDVYKKKRDRDRFFLRSHKAKRLDSYVPNISNTQKRFLRGVAERQVSRSYAGIFTFNRTKRKFKPDTWRILKLLKKEKTLCADTRLFKIPKKRRLTSKKVWRLRQLFFKKGILKKHPNYKKTLDKTKQIIENPSKKELSISEFLEKFKVLELQQRKHSDENKPALIESFVYKK